MTVLHFKVLFGVRQLSVGKIVCVCACMCICFVFLCLVFVEEEVQIQTSVDKFKT